MIDLRPGVDRLTLPAQVGVRLLDPATGRVVSDGLQVRLWPDGRPERIAAAIVNRAGVFVAHPLPTPKPPPPEPEPPRPWVVEVVDTQARFLPLRFVAVLPSNQLHDIALLSPPFDSDLPIGGVPLFSAPTRSLPAGLAVLSADLRTAAGTPAAWAIAEALLIERNGDVGPTLGWGMADQHGSLFVLIQTPRMRSVAAGPDQPWTVRLIVRYAAPADGRAPAIPEWDTALRQPDVQPLGSLSPIHPLDDLSVQAGQTLVVQTAGMSELLLDV
jgi:hypothetical protein